MPKPISTGELSLQIYSDTRQLVLRSPKTEEGKEKQAAMM